MVMQGQQRESVCVCVCTRESMCMYMCVRESVCKFVCERERVSDERKRVRSSMCEREGCA